MVMRVQLVEGEYRVVLPREAMDALKLTEGAEVTVVPAPSAGVSKYIGVEEAMKSYFQTEPQHREAYRKLAE